MLHDAHEKTAAVLRTFVEMQRGPNPLSRADVAKLIAKRPEHYGVLSAWA
jgi:hypothetical protein